MGSRHTPETKAAVIAALLAGQSVSYVAKEYSIPIGTIKNWKSTEINQKKQPEVITQKKATIGGLVMGLLEEELITLQEMSRAVRNVEWLEKQNAADVAVLLGVMQDKAFRKIEALDRNARPKD